MTLYVTPSLEHSLMFRRDAMASRSCNSPLVVRPTFATMMFRRCGVVPKDVLVLPDDKRVARGTWVGSPMQVIHTDDRLYDRPMRPFSVCEIRI